MIIRIASLFPELLGTYGDGGNVTVLAQRARRRGYEVDVVTVGVTQTLPRADLYVIGGGEDGPQRQAADRLRSSPLREFVSDGAKVFAVCAGLQILGRQFAVSGDDEYEGVGLVDAVTVRGRARSVGDLVTSIGERRLIGFENHGGETTIGVGVSPLGRVVRGRGNDGHVDGFLTPEIVATYAHGPVLAINPWWADSLLEMVIRAPLEPLTSIADQLYSQRRRTLGV